MIIDPEAASYTVSRQAYLFDYTIAINVDISDAESPSLTRHHVFPVVVLLSSPRIDEHSA